MKCAYRWKNGKQCCLQAQHGEQFCWNHDPEHKDARKKIGKRSRTKGSTYERQVVRDLKSIFGDNIKRGLAQSRFGAGEAPDVDGVPCLWFEVKHGKQVNLRAAYAQAVDAMAAAGRTKDRWPVAVCKDDRKNALVVMGWDHFLELLAEWHDVSPHK